jgi:hypothetical protein
MCFDEAELHLSNLRIPTLVESFIPKLHTQDSHSVVNLLSGNVHLSLSVLCSVCLNFVYRRL